jgi:hypothetical protein
MNRGWRAHVFRSHTDSEWSEVAYLARNQELGSGYAPIAQSVAIDGAVAVAGTRLDDSRGLFAGAIYVLQKDSGGWGQHGKLTAGDGVAGDYFGTSVDVHESRIVVGAPGAGSELGRTGAAYVFRRDLAGQWNQVAKLAPSDLESADEFGTAVALNGSTIAVGTRLDDDGGVSSGSVYLFRNDHGNDWTQLTKLYASDPTRRGLFGHAISMSGMRMLVGSPGAFNQDWMNFGGAAYMFEEDGDGNWNQIARFQPDSVLDEGFGYSVSLLGSLAIVGANQNGSQITDKPGAAYIFQDDGTGNWLQIGKIVSNMPASAEKFGMGVATNGSSIFVAAQRLLGEDRVSGLVYVYAIPEPSSAMMMACGICCIAAAGLRRGAYHRC